MKNERIIRGVAAFFIAAMMTVNIIVLISLREINENITAVAVSEPVSSADIKREPDSSEKKLSESELDRIHDLTKNMILYHGIYDEKADAKVDELLGELYGIDRDYGDLWKKIMDYWEYTNTDFKVNYKEVPEGLPEGDNLCIIILGYQLDDYGGIKYELNGRLKAALKCIEKYPNAPVICTGGGTAEKNHQATEAGQMVKWLKKKGVDENRLIAEDQSESTAENAIFSDEILRRDYPQVDSVLLISSKYHLLWSDLIFQSAFMKSSLENNSHEIKVISNYAFNTDHYFFKASQKMQWQTGSMLELIGEDDLMEIFYSNYKYQNYLKNDKPEL